MAETIDEGTDKISLEQQLEGLLIGIESEPFPDELRRLAEELQTAIRRHLDAEDTSK